MDKKDPLTKATPDRTLLKEAPSKSTQTGPKPSPDIGMYGFP